MSRTMLVFLVVISISCSVFSNAEQTEVVNGIEEGQSMPLHVVHFVAGARQSGKGCPSVMISNRKLRGLEIWASAPSNQAFELAGALEQVLGDDSLNRSFMIIGDRPEKEELIALAKKQGVTKTTVCVPNSKKLFQNAKFTEDRDLFVFFLDRKQIIRRHDFKASELSSEDRKNLRNDFEMFLTNAP